MSDASEPETIIERRGSAGVIVLNRPKALNALTHGMVRTIHPQLLAWREDPAVTRIVILGAGDRAFCAGGDIRALYDLARAGRLSEAGAFWREEYTLNHLLKTYPKPIVALVGGIVMGGGVGMSIHVSHRVVSEKLVFAMPEVGIGFFPDVGASHVLPRLPHRIGVYLALTGARIGMGDALGLGLATHGVGHARLAELADALTTEESVDDVLARYAVAWPAAPLMEQASEIERFFLGDTIADIFDHLAAGEAAGSDFAAATLRGMRGKSPTSLAIAIEQMRRGARMSFAEAMRMEYRIVRRIAEGPDFAEGVRAAIIDKDLRPRWTPPRVEDLDAAAIARHFEPLADDLALE